LETAKIAPTTDWLENQVQAQKKNCESRVAMTNTGQRNYEPNYAAVYVLLVAKEMSQFISVPDVTWGWAWCLVSWKISKI